MAAIDVYINETERFLCHKLLDTYFSHVGTYDRDIGFPSAAFRVWERVEDMNLLARVGKYSEYKKEDNYCGELK